MGREWNFRQSVLRRALRVAEEDGIAVSKIEIGSDGKIVLIRATDRNNPASNPWDDELPK